MDQYVFSGTATDKPAVTSPGGAAALRIYGRLGRQESPGAELGKRADEYSRQQGASISTAAREQATTDLFTMVANVRDAVASGDVNAVERQLDNINANLDNVLSCRSRVGSWMQRIDNAHRCTWRTARSEWRRLLSDEEDVDLPSAVIQLQTQQNVYQAALSVSSQSNETISGKHAMILRIESAEQLSNGRIMKMRVETTRFGS